MSEVKQKLNYKSIEDSNYISSAFQNTTYFSGRNGKLWLVSSIVREHETESKLLVNLD